MHEFVTTISSKSLDPNWETYLDNFKNAAKEFFRPCQHIGKDNKHCSYIFLEYLLDLILTIIKGILYLHTIEHTRDFIHRTKLSPGLVCNDQVRRILVENHC